MKEALVQGKTLPEAYHKALMALYTEGDITECPDYDQKQKELSMTMYVDGPMSEPMVSRLYIGGHADLQQYVMEVMDGILNFRIGSGWDYTYNSRISEQLPFIYRELARNPYSRRAVIDIRDWKYDSKEGNTSPACLQHMQFFIREGKLHLKVVMRSNDAAEATFMNAFAFIMLQKKIVDRLGCAMGSYTHRANSFHCYEKDFDLLRHYAEGITKKDISDITYDYERFYKDLMEESIPGILAKVEQIRERTGQP
jgi:thymidylate synthase